MSDVLDYAGAKTNPYSPGIGYWLIFSVNACSFGFIIYNLPSFGLYGAGAGNGIIGDSYGPMLGIFFGIPYTFGQLMVGVVPALIYCGKFHGVAKSRILLPILLPSIVTLLASGALTLACILAPRTHGSTC
jgi:hypothetical protein